MSRSKMSQNNGSFAPYNASRTPSMPPYNTDPQLSIMRHADPEYVNSSDPSADLYSSSTLSSVVIPSSPPHIPVIDSEPGDIDMETGDVPTDEDMTDDDEAGGAHAESTLRYEHNAAPSSSFNAAPTNKAQKAMSGASSYLAAPTNSFTWAARSESSFALRTPESIVSSVFDNDKQCDLMFDGMNLTRIPDVVRDLIDHTDLSSYRPFRMNFSHNSLFTFNQSMYQISRLEFLDLRYNQLTELSALVGEFDNLRELHLGHNKLKSLPVELLHLPKLKVLTTYPNEFIKIPKDLTFSDDGTQVKCERMYCVMKIVTLQELAKRSLLKILWDMTTTDIDFNLSEWGDEAVQLLSSTRHAVDVGSICTVCKHPLVEPVAFHLQWKRHGQDRSGEIVPFRTLFCTGKCLATF